MLQMGSLRLSFWKRFPRSSFRGQSDARWGFDQESSFTVSKLDDFVPADHPLRSAPNLLLTPHQASFGFDTGARVSEAAAQAIVDLKASRKPRWMVNPEVYSSPNLRVKVS